MRAYRTAPERLNIVRMCFVLGMCIADAAAYARVSMPVARHLAKEEGYTWLVREHKRVKPLTPWQRALVKQYLRQGKSDVWIIAETGVHVENIDECRAEQRLRRLRAKRRT